MAFGKKGLFLILVLVIAGIGYYGASRLGDGPAVAAENIRGSVPTPPATDPNVLLPDLIPLPPADVQLDKREDGMYLLFSTTYYNQGLGQFELRADPKTAGVRADIARDVMQRVYLKDGGYEDSLVGNFLWHQEHLHYHYADFITYDLSVVDAPPNPELDGMLTKSTFCLRDISRVFLPLENKRDVAEYKICCKELQGVSVGWGDTYYFDYPGQALNISSLKSGTYKLEFVVNPNRRLKELSFDNNVASAVIKLDMELGTVAVVSTIPSEIPKYEYVHLEDPFGIQYR